MFFGEAASLDIRVYSVSGALVFSAASGSDETDIDLSALSAGVYVLNVNGSENRKILLK